MQQTDRHDKNIKDDPRERGRYTGVSADGFGNTVFWIRDVWRSASSITQLANPNRGWYLIDITRAPLENAERIVSIGADDSRPEWGLQELYLFFGVDRKALVSGERWLVFMVPEGIAGSVVDRFCLGIGVEPLRTFCVTW